MDGIEYNGSSREYKLAVRHNSSCLRSAELFMTYEMAIEFFCCWIKSYLHKILHVSCAIVEYKFFFSFSDVQFNLFHTLKSVTAFFFFSFKICESAIVCTL